MQILYILYFTPSLRIDLKFLSLLRVWLSPYFYVVYIEHLLKRLVIRSMSLVSVESEVAIAIIPPLIMEADPGAIVVLV